MAWINSPWEIEIKERLRPQPGQSKWVIKWKKQRGRLVACLTVSRNESKKTELNTVKGNPLFLRACIIKKARFHGGKRASLQ